MNEGVKSSGWKSGVRKVVKESLQGKGSQIQERLSFQRQVEPGAGVDETFELGRQ